MRFAGLFSVFILVYAFERHLGDQCLLVFNHFYADEVALEWPSVYQTGKVVISNYEEGILGDWVTIKPCQTLAILVNN
ncbi:UNVERIFIED_CONTAM: glutamate racemase [Streptococcus canis]